MFWSMLECLGFSGLNKDYIQAENTYERYKYPGCPFSSSYLAVGRNEKSMRMLAVLLNSSKTPPRPAKSP